MNVRTKCSLAGATFAAAALLTVQAQAADLGRSGPGDSSAYMSGSWAGAYVGGHLGAAWTSGSADLATEHWHIDNGNQNSTTHFYGSGHEDLDETSFLGGVHAGYNFQQSVFVYGVEGDVSFAGNLDYLASVRGRLGVAAGNWLFYGSGGAAFAGTNMSGAISDQYGAVEHYNVSDSQVGFVVGGGAEVKMGGNWSIGLEGLYYGFDGVSQDRSGRTLNPNENNYYNYDMHAEAAGDVGVVRGRVSYHLGGRGYDALK